MRLTNSVMNLVTNSRDSTSIGSVAIKSSISILMLSTNVDIVSHFVRLVTRNMLTPAHLMMVHAGYQMDGVYLNINAKAKQEENSAVVCKHYEHM